MAQFGRAPALTINNYMDCKFCKKICKNLNSVTQHEMRCPKNPQRIVSWLEKNRSKLLPVWNKGLTKTTSEKVSAHSKIVQKTMITKYKEGYRSPTHLQEYWTEEKRKQKSEWRKQLHKEHPETHPNRKLSKNRKNISYPEKIAYDWFTNNNIIFEHQKPIGKFYVDFCVGNIIIEIDGEWWHPKGNIKDRMRDEELIKQGYIVHRIPTKSRIEEALRTIFAHEYESSTGVLGTPRGGAVPPCATIQ